MIDRRAVFFVSKLAIVSSSRMRSHMNALVLEAYDRGKARHVTRDEKQQVGGRRW